MTEEHFGEKLLDAEMQLSEAELQAEDDESDKIDWLLGMEGFTTAAINAVREDPSAHAEIRGIFEHCISPEAKSTAA